MFDTHLLFECHQKTRAYQHDQNISPKINILRAKDSCCRFAGINKSTQWVFNDTEIENTSSRGKCPKKGFGHDWLCVKNRTSEIPDTEKNVIKPFRI